jgi:hypothetical protein
MIETERPRRERLRGVCRAPGDGEATMHGVWRVDEGFTAGDSRSEANQRGRRRGEERKSEAVGSRERERELQLFL